MSIVRLVVIRTVLVVALLAIAVLFAAHDAIWTTLVAVVVFLFGFLLLRKAQTGTRGRRRIAATFIACGLVLAGGTELVRDGWIEATGKVATTTVVHADTYCTGRNSCDRREEYTLRLADGDTVPGDLRGFDPGAYHVGDHATVRYDPLGLVRAPVQATENRSSHELVGLVGLLAGIALIAGLVATATWWQRRPGEPATPQRSNL